MLQLINKLQPGHTRARIDGRLRILFYNIYIYSFFKFFSEFILKRMRKEEKRSDSKENTKLGEIRDKLCDSGSTLELLTSSKTHKQ